MAYLGGHTSCLFELIATVLSRHELVSTSNDEHHDSQRLPGISYMGPRGPPLRKISPAHLLT